MKSYGTGSSVKLPGRTATQPIIYPFNVPYEQMRTELQQRDPALYASNGVLSMLDRNAKIKRAPEQWRDARDRFDLIITFEDRVFKAVVEDFVANRSPVVFAPGYVVNLEVRDTHVDAAAGAKIAVDLVEAVNELDNLDSNIWDAVSVIEKKTELCIPVVPVFF